MLLGVGFSLFLCAQLVQEGLIGIGLMLALLAVYYGAGQLAARLAARLAFRSGVPRSSASLYLASLKTGALFTIGSLLFHLALLVALETQLHVGLTVPAKESILLRAAVFPFLACMGAACTASNTALPEAARMVHLPTESDVTALTD